LSWATESRLKHLEEIATADLEAFRDTWEDGPLAKKKKQERLIGFFYYCLRLGWIKSNPAVSLGRIRADGPPTDYFPKHEFDHIIDATYIYQPKGWVECRNQATRLRILTLLMRWSGLAIRDAVTLERRRLIVERAETRLRSFLSRRLPVSPGSYLPTLFAASNITFNTSFGLESIAT